MCSRDPTRPSLSLPKRYTNASLLGTGGLGRVFRVNDSIRTLDLALKVVGPSEASWLLAEFDTLRQIRHENLIRVFDRGALQSGEAYYTMELIEGGDWGAGFGGPQAAERVKLIVQGVGRALAHLHSHGEVHGDLKPGNVLLGDGDVVKLTDVGMGRSARSEERISGTPGYAAPEVWEGMTGDPRSDIYSVGVMAYEAIAGRHPFAGRTIKDVVTGQLEGWVPSPRAHGVALPPDLERAIMRALERKPALRHASVDEFLDDIGVKDRIGEILGGKIVGRDVEIDEFGRLLAWNDPKAVTLVHVTGPPGIGKTSIVEEFGQRLLAQGGRFLRPAAPSAGGVADALSHSDTIGHPWSTANEHSSLSGVAGALTQAADQGPILVCFTALPGEEKRTLEFTQSLGRYLWALSVESGHHKPVLLCLEHGGPASTFDEFEHNLQVSPLDQPGTERLIGGVLGQMSLETEVVTRIHTVTGGSPGGIRALLTELIGNELLQRITGTWKFREIGRLADLALSGAASRWALAWGRLSGDQRALLTLLCQVPRGLAATALERVLPGHTRLLAELASRGWVRQLAGGWTLAAEEIRAAISDLAEGRESRAAEARLLAEQDISLTREEKASLLLRVGPPKVALEEGLWAAQQAASRGEFSLARDRALECLNIAAAENDRTAAQRAAIRLGEALHQMGSDDEAERILQEEGTWAAGIPTGISAERLYLLGRIASARGRIPEARGLLTSAIEVAEAGRELPIFLRAHADLAEIDWRYGDETTRAASMRRVRSVLAQHHTDNELNDERAALSYQYGSALVLGGEREQARQFLTKALELKPRDFWRMRIANALATACFALGDFDRSLQWLVEAWSCAERGGIDAFKARIHSNRAGLFYGLGRFREAVEEHGFSAQWARRTGNAYEFQASRVGESVNLSLLGRYEGAIDLAREALHTSERLGSVHECAKALEIESLAFYHVGDYGESRRLVEEAFARMKDHGFDDVLPRLRWLSARIDIEAGLLASAEESLERAEEELRRTKDWEDLPGVQIEAQHVRFRKGDPAFNLAEVRRLAVEADRARALIVYLHGAVISSEVIVAGGVDHREFDEFLLDALARAEGSGTPEISWRISHALGEIASREADSKGASARFAHAVRRMTEVADRLSPEHRRFYLKTAHARRLLERASAVGQSN